MQCFRKHITKYMPMAITTVEELQVNSNCVIISNVVLFYDLELAYFNSVLQ